MQLGWSTYRFTRLMLLPPLLHGHRAPDVRGCCGRRIPPRAPPEGGHRHSCGDYLFIFVTKWKSCIETFPPATVPNSLSDNTRGLASASFQSAASAASCWVVSGVCMVLPSYVKGDEA